MPNFEKKYHILHRQKHIADLRRDTQNDREQNREKAGTAAQKKLFDVRSLRDRPFRNDIAITAWSGLMIGAYAKAGETFGDKSYVNTAIEAAKHVLKQQKTAESRLFRTYGAPPAKPRSRRAPPIWKTMPSSSTAYSTCTTPPSKRNGSMTRSPSAIPWSASMARTKRGGYFITANDHEKLFARAKDQHDGAAPPATASPSAISPASGKPPATIASSPKPIKASAISPARSSLTVQA